ACAGDVPALDCLFQIAPRQRLCKYRNDGRIAGGDGNNGLHPHHHGLVLGVAPAVPLNPSTSARAREAGSSNQTTAGSAAWNAALMSVAICFAFSTDCGRAPKPEESQRYS